MARTAIPVVPVTRDGVSFTAAGTSGDATNDHVVSNSGKTYIRVKNASGAPLDVTFNFSHTVDGYTVAPRVEQVPATTGDMLFGPFPVNDYGSRLNIDITTGASITFWAYEMA